MQLSSVISNIINRYTNRTSPITILYEPKYSLLDHIMFLTGFRFIIRENAKYTFNTDNVINIPDIFLDLYPYTLYISYTVEKFANNNTSIDNIFHIPSIILIDNIKLSKKEDLYLLSNRLKHNNKCFLKNHLLEKLNATKSVQQNIGIPSHLFVNTKPYTERKSVAILGKNMLSDQIASFLNAKNIDFEIIDLYDNISNINAKLNNYRFCIDLSENYQENLLCASCSGCRCITLSKNEKILDDIKHFDNLDEIYNYIMVHNNICPDTKAITREIDNRFSFDSFMLFMKKYIDTVNKEAYIK